MTLRCKSVAVLVRTAQSLLSNLPVQNFDVSLHSAADSLLIIGAVGWVYPSVTDCTLCLLHACCRYIRAPEPLHGHTQGWVKIWDTIMANWRGPLPAAMPPQQQGPPTEASASTAHSLDLQLRRMLADAVACIGGAAQKADAARQLNAERKQLLARWCFGCSCKERLLYGPLSVASCADVWLYGAGLPDLLGSSDLVSTLGSSAEV